MSAWFIIAQVMGGITICIDFITYQIKEQRRYLLVYSVGSVFWTLMFVFLGLDLVGNPPGEPGFFSVVGPLIAAFFGAFRSIVFWWIFAKNTKKRKIGGKVFLYAALAVGVGAAIYSILQVDAAVRWIPIVGMFAALSFIVGQYLPSKHWLRLFQVLYAAAMALTQIPYYIGKWNYMGIVIEAIKIVSIALFYGIYIYRAYLAKKLPEIKAAIDGEMNKIASGDTTAMPPEQLEKLWVKKLRYELGVIDKEKLTNFKNTEENMQAVVADMNSLPSVKELLQKAAGEKNPEQPCLSG